MRLDLLQNSLAVAALSSAGALALGACVALWLLGGGRTGRAFGLTGGILTLALPPFLVTNCWLNLFGLTGVLKPWIPFNIYSLSGSVLILTLLFWPIPMLLILREWSRIEASQLESDPAARGWALIRALLLPAARPAFALSTALTFTLALNQFAVPAILQTRVLPADVWISFNTTFDYNQAIAKGWPLIAVPLLLVIVLSRAAGGWPGFHVPANAALFRRQLGPWFPISCAIGLATLLLSAGLPLADLLTQGRTWLELPAAVAAGTSAVWNSFWIAAGTATLCAAAGLAIARFRWVGLFWIVFLVPGILLGITLIFLFNRPASQWIYGSMLMVLLGLTIRYLAIAWTGGRLALRGIDPDISGSAALDGASGWNLFWRITFPQIAAKIAIVWYITFLFCLWDVETLLFILPPGGETLSLRIFNLLHYGHNTQVNALCLALLGLALLPLAAWFVWSGLSLRTFRLPHLRLALPALVLAVTGCETENAPNLSNSTLFSRVEIIGSRGTGAGQFNKPRSVAVDLDDHLYVADMTGRVQKFSPTGEYLLSWQMPETDLGKPKGMCRDGAGNIVVLEPHYSRVNHFSTSGELLSQWGLNGTNQGQLMFPRSVAVNSRGDVFVSEYGRVDRVQQFTASGNEHLLTFGAAGSRHGQFNRPEGVGIDAQGRIYVADSCNHRVQVFSPDGGFIREYGKAGRGPGEMSYPYDAQVDAAGRQYVCEFGNSRIQIFDRSGRLLEILGSIGSEPGQFSNPWSIALDSKGNLYVADSRNHRVQKFIARPQLAGTHFGKGRSS